MLSRGPATIGICASDLPACCQILNAAQQRLLYARETSDTGFWGAWAQIVFNLSRTSPTFTAPREVGRLIAVDVCKYPIPVVNQWYEFLEFGVGYQPKSNTCASDQCAIMRAYDRGVVPTFTDLTPTNKTIRVYPSDSADAGLRTLISGYDNNNQPLTSLDGPVQVNGVYVSFQLPFADLVVPGTTTQIEVSKLTGIQKDITIGPVSYYEVDLTSGAATLLLTMEPGETTAGYRRYFVNWLPRSCCNPPGTVSTNVQVKALAKLELIPARVDSDYLLVQNLEALISECQSIRYSEIDGAESKQQAQERHVQAIRLLQGELTHYEGRNSPAIGFFPFGSAKLSNQRIGSML